ncbi:GNAT family N-acetyltransferase [Streptomyces sp. STR69]|uniref:GNAT family N-acetyltransferase n=1 Tax=Streptomyces sp. STR69 TaxID=1796942 RepID=UPI0021C6597D|nr:GNAT family protein [Streptomyces sp. STR69]
MNPVTLTTENLILGQMQLTDLDAIVAAWSDPEIRRWTTVPVPGTREQARDFVLSTCEGGWEADHQYIFGVRTKNSVDLVGCSGIFGVSTVGRSESMAYIGCWTVKEQRGKGYTTEAVRELCRWAFSELDMVRIEGVGEVGNHASMAMVLKAGFQLEGTLRGRMKQDGTQRDAWLASLLPHDLGLLSAIPYLTPED